MNKWNCLIIDSILKKEINDDRLNAPKEMIVDITSLDGFEYYNFEDYDVFFINFDNKYSYDQNQIDALVRLMSGELKQIKFIFASRRSFLLYDGRKKSTEISDIISYLCKGIPNSINKSGNKIIITNHEYSLSKLLFNEKNQPYHWKWAITSDYLPNNSYILARNKKGHVISLITKFKDNFLIFLPHPTLKRDFIETCLANFDKFELELYKRGLDFPIEEPSWLKDYDPFKKKELKDQLLEAKEKIERIESYEILLYGYGKPLENTISKIFSFLGFQNILRTVDRADLICETEKSKIIAEIKGLKDIAHERNIAQMYKWHVIELEKVEKSVKKIKQIFICNAYRNKKPEERESYFDEKVIKNSETHNWGLLSTWELYKSLLKIWNGELTKDQVISIIENQVGVLEF